MENPDKVFIAVVDLNRPNTIMHVSIPEDVFRKIEDMEEWLEKNDFNSKYCQWWELEDGPDFKIHFIEKNA